MLREIDRGGAIFDLPSGRFTLGDPRRDLSVRIHGAPAATPLGPAAGPHTQLAQNIVLSWLAGGRVIELKTVQILDQLVIPRPCIDAATIGYNIEWSQELRLEASLEEYVKAAMLIEILAQSGALPIPPGGARTVYDISVGYDLQGIASPRIRAFVRGLRDARETVDRLRRSLPDDLKRYRDFDFPTRLSDTVTLSTFHGCPPAEIERIVELLLREEGLSCTVKLNPTLLGEAEVRGLLHDTLGYRDVRVPPDAFERDAQWAQVAESIDRLLPFARSLGRGLGVKLTNTLVVENHRGVLPSEDGRMYLSGPPLHVLAMRLVQRFRKAFGDRLPISFSGGIDHDNFADAVALGLSPITVCTDWLKPGGYGRAHRYFEELGRRMDRVGAAYRLGSAEAGVAYRDDFILCARGQALGALDALGLDAGARRACEEALRTGGDLRRAAGEDVYARWVAEAASRNTALYAEEVLASPRYREDHHRREPRKLGRSLSLFDCTTCDKCIPVCPNDANFAFAVPAQEIPIVKLRREGEGFLRVREGTIRIDEAHQIGHFADLCNACGNCDVFCPEDGGPHRQKPRFFGSAEAFHASAEADGFYLERRRGRIRVLGRIGGAAYEVEIEGDRVTYAGEGFRVSFSARDPEGTAAGEGAEIDLTPYRIMDVLRASLLSGTEINFVNCIAEVNA